MATTVRGAVARRSAQTALLLASLPPASPQLCPCLRPMVRRDHSAMQRSVSDWECIPLRCVSALTPAHPSACRAACVSQRVHCPSRPLALLCPLTPPPIAILLECRQCVRMEAQRLLSHASFAASNLPPRDQRITQVHAPRPFCHAFECSTVGVHTYQSAVPVFNFSISRANEE
jgi:hypothetical protein